MSKQAHENTKPVRESIHGLSGIEYRVLAGEVVSSGRHFTRVQIANGKIVEVDDIHGEVEPGDDVFLTSKVRRDGKKMTTACGVSSSLLTVKSRPETEDQNRQSRTPIAKREMQSTGRRNQHVTPPPPPKPPELRPPKPTNPPKANPHRRLSGEVTRVHPSQAFGEIIDARSGRAFFVHHSELPSGTPLMEGLRLTFQSVDTAKGVKAIHCQAI